MFGGKQYHVMANAVEVKRYQYKPSVAEKIRNEWNISDELWLDMWEDSIHKKSHVSNRYFL